jgi:hypothetical protein
LNSVSFFTYKKSHYKISYSLLKINVGFHTKECNFAPHRGMEQLVARRAHNPKVIGSSPVPATKQNALDRLSDAFFCFLYLIFSIFRNTIDIYCNTHMLSFWEQQTYLEYDFIVVGAGIMGCSVAYELRLKYPKARIVVLERGLFPTGASTKNAGFACFGSPTEMISDFKLHGTQKSVGYYLKPIRRIKDLNRATRF